MRITLKKGILLIGLLVVAMLAGCAGGKVDHSITFQVPIRIVDDRSGSPIEGAKVIVNSHMDTTKENGEVLIPDIYGSMTVEVQAEGYWPFEDQFSVYNDGTITIPLENNDTLNEISNDGTQVEIGGLSYFVTDNPGLQHYLAQLNTEVYGAAMYIELEDNIITAVNGVILENKEYSVEAFNSLLRPSYPETIDCDFQVSEVSFEGQVDTSVGLASSGPSHSEVVIMMSGAVIKSIKFKTDVTICGSPDRYIEDATLDSFEVEGKLTVQYARNVELQDGRVVGSSILHGDAENVWFRYIVFDDVVNFDFSSNENGNSYTFGETTLNNNFANLGAGVQFSGVTFAESGGEVNFDQPTLVFSVEFTVPVIVSAPSRFLHSTFKHPVKVDWRFNDWTSDHTETRFTDSIFESPVMITDTSRATFRNTIHKSGLDIYAHDTFFENTEFDLVSDLLVNIHADSMFRIIDVEGNGNLTVKVATNKKVQFLDQINFENLNGEFIIDLTAGEANYYDYTAEWSPKEPIIKTH